MGCYCYGLVGVVFMFRWGYVSVGLVSVIFDLVCECLLFLCGGAVIWRFDACALFCALASA